MLIRNDGLHCDGCSNRSTVCFIADETNPFHQQAIPLVLAVTIPLFSLSLSLALALTDCLSVVSVGRTLTASNITTTTIALGLPPSVMIAPFCLSQHGHTHILVSIVQVSFGMLTTRRIHQKYLSNLSQRFHKQAHNHKHTQSHLSCCHQQVHRSGRATHGNESFVGLHWFVLCGLCAGLFCDILLITTSLSFSSSMHASQTRHSRSCFLLLFSALFCDRLLRATHFAVFLSEWALPVINTTPSNRPGIAFPSNSFPSTPQLYNLSVSLSTATTLF